MSWRPTAGRFPAMVVSPNCAVSSTPPSSLVCNPVLAASTIMKNGLLGPEDVRTLLAVDALDMPRVVAHLQTLAADEYYSIYPPSGGSDGAPLAPKQLSTISCGGYGMVVIDQKFEDIEAKTQSLMRLDIHGSD